jgi:hypothetical protein
MWIGYANSPTTCIIPNGFLKKTYTCVLNIFEKE